MCRGKSEIDIAESALDTAYVEYLFCDFGPDISQESFAELLIEWNDILDGLETAVPMSVGLVPRTEQIYTTDCGLWYGNQKNKQTRVGKNG